MAQYGLGGSYRTDTLCYYVLYNYSFRNTTKISGIRTIMIMTKTNEPATNNRSVKPTTKGMRKSKSEASDKQVRIETKKLSVYYGSAVGIKRCITFDVQQ